MGSRMLRRWIHRPLRNREQVKQRHASIGELIERGAYLDLQVIDSGIGIASEDQNRIFDKFSGLGSVALHSTGKYKFKGGGPGLGLAITRGIIEAHDGQIWVESDGYDEDACPGSTFHILIPLLDAPPE